MLIVGLFLAGLLGYALVSRLLDRWSLTPHIVVLTLGLVAGLIVDRATLGFDASVLHGAGEIALILALFVDAARIDVGALRGTAVLPVRLLAIGLPLTVLAGFVAALLLLPGLTPVEAFLLAALVAPTDASLGAIVVSSPMIPLRVRQALNVESGLNDGLITPVVVFAAAATIAGADSTGAGDMLGVAARQVVLGVVAGLVVGAGGALAIRAADARHLILPAARWIAALVLALLAWFVAHELEGNAFVAAFVAGLAYAATIRRARAEDLEIGEVGSELLALLTFFLFGVLVPTIGGFDLPVIAFAVVALTIVRLGPVAVALLGTGLSRASVLFMGWFGPSGLASIVLAIVAIGDDRGAPGFAPMVLSAVAATVVLSVFAHGLSAGPAVRAHARAAGRLPPGSPEHGEAVEVRPRRGVAGIDRSGVAGRSPDATTAAAGGPGD